MTSMTSTTAVRSIYFIQIFTFLLVYNSISLRSQIKTFPSFKKPLPKELKEKLKLNFDALPPPEDFISVTDSNPGSQDMNESLNDSEWENVI